MGEGRGGEGGWGEACLYSSKLFRDKAKKNTDQYFNAWADTVAQVITPNPMTPWSLSYSKLVLDNYATIVQNLQAYLSSPGTSLWQRSNRSHSARYHSSSRTILRGSLQHTDLVQTHFPGKSCTSESKDHHLGGAWSRSWTMHLHLSVHGFCYNRHNIIMLIKFAVLILIPSLIT